MIYLGEKARWIVIPVGRYGTARWCGIGANYLIDFRLSVITQIIDEGRWKQDKFRASRFRATKSWFRGCACAGFGISSEGTRFHLGASMRHGSNGRPDEREARDIR